MTTANTAVGSSTTSSGGAVTTTLANSAVVALAQGFADSFAAESGYTQVASPNAGFGAEYAIESTPGSFTPTMTLSSSATWVQTTLVVHP
jgi:hypothetical protein